MSLNPKNKASELIEKYYQVGKNHDIDYAKDCALIAVDEILSLLNECEKSEAGFYNSDYFIDYYLEVKQEIEKL